jgi:hypothetical protein
MQLRFKTELSCEEYVRCWSWRDASLAVCPLHPEGGCSFTRHGTYPRVEPSGMRVARWYCPQGHQTFSLLPDCLASRLPGSLQAIERVCAEVEQARSFEAAADALRTQDVSLQSAIRWTRRRVKLVQGNLASVLAVIPNTVGSCRPSVIEFQHRMNTDCVLYQLRETASAYLVTLPPPLGFGARRARNGEDEGSFQHDKGPDPPSVVPYGGSAVIRARGKPNATEEYLSTRFRTDISRRRAGMA